MFYCSACAKRNRWPETVHKSYGPCELCEVVTDCNDRPPYTLPEPPNRKDLNEQDR